MAETRKEKINRLRSENKWDEAAKLVGQDSPGGTSGDDDDFDLETANVKDILDWVGDDADRAQQALDAEEDRDEPRSTLVEKLEALTEEEEDDEE